MVSSVEPEVTLVRQEVKFEAQERIFCSEIGLRQLSQSDALKRAPLPVFAKNVTYRAKNVYLSGSFLEQFEHLQYENKKDVIPEEIQTQLQAQACGTDDVRLSSRWRQNYLYEVIASDAPCHLYFDIDGAIPEGEERKAQDFKQSTLFKLCCAELKAQMSTVPSFNTVNASMFVLDASDATKYSRHLILQFPGFAFSNNAHCGAFVRYLCGKYGSELNGYGVDLTVYSKNRLFRSAYCSKGKSPKRVFWPHSVVRSTGTTVCSVDHHLGPRSSLFHESLITNVFLFHRAAYLPYIYLIGYNEAFLRHYGSTSLIRKRSRESDLPDPGSRIKRRSSGGTISTRIDIWQTPFLELCRRDIAVAFSYNLMNDFHEYVTFNMDDSSARGSVLFPMRTGVCSFRPNNPHSSEHSYVVVDLRKLTFRALCHSDKSPCRESKLANSWQTLSREAIRLYNANEFYNKLILAALPDLLYSQG